MPDFCNRRRQSRPGPARRTKKKLTFSCFTGRYRRRRQQGKHLSRSFGLRLLPGVVWRRRVLCFELPLYAKNFCFFS